MKLLFDARYIRTDFHDGVSRYSAELGGALARLTPVLFIICDKRQLRSLPRDADFIMIHSPTSVKEPLTSLILNRHKPDVVFSPMQTMGSFGHRFKLILTLHDMIYYLHREPPHYLSPFIRFIWRLYHMSYVPQRLTLNAADVVATVSGTSKQEIEKARLTKRSVIVVPNAPRDLSELTKAPDLKKSPRDLVFIGSFMPYKNVETLIAGMEYLSGYTLHLLSKVTPARRAQLEKIIPTGASVKFHNGVSDEAYAKLLSKSIYVSASRAEGYGLPIAESLALGVPAVVSDIPIHREVAGDGALYFSPTDARGFANAVHELEVPARRATVASAGKRHIQNFSWERSAQLLLLAAKELANEKESANQ